jgi:MFS family permease
MLFIANALVFSSIATRFPEIKDRFELSELIFGLMVACGPVGSVLGTLVASRLIARFGADRAAATASASIGLLLVVAGFAGGPIAFGVVLFAIGFGDAVGDIGNNAHGLAVQRLLQRSIINGLHGAWSSGAITGGLLGGLALLLGIPIEAYLPFMGVAIVILSFVAFRGLRLPDAPPVETTRATHARARVSALLIAACCIAFCGAFLEDLGATWGGVFAVTQTGAPIAEAAAPFIALMTGLTVGRFLSDSVVNRFGPVRTVQAGSIVSIIGIVIVVIAPTPLVVSIGLGALGLGIAPMIPLAMDAAERAPFLRPGEGLGISGFVLRLGLFVSPLLVGGIAELAGLRIAVAACLVVPVAAFVAARWIRYAAHERVGAADP